jgi:AcrR family transcriptional regulator
MDHPYQMRTTFAIKKRMTFAFVKTACYTRRVGSTRRADKRRKVEEAVLDAATEMLRAGGPGALTMAELASGLELSVGGLYRYYPGKGAILVGLEKRAIASYRAVQEDLLATLEPRLSRRTPEVAALSRVLAASSAYLEHARRDPVQHRLMTQLLAAPEALLDAREVHEVETHVRPVIERGATLIAAAAAARALSPGDAAKRTFVLWAALQGADQFRKRDRVLPESLHSWALADAAIDALLLGWGARPRELATARRLVPPLAHPQSAQK